MLYGVFSDVHSNFEALERVLDFFESSKVDGYICCGDLVGYGPQPEECLEKIRALKNLSLIGGNHDMAAIGRMDMAWFNPYARSAIAWTQGKLSESGKAFLGTLKAKLQTKDFTVAHGTPRNPLEEYLLSPDQFKDNFSHVRAWPLFVGHSHRPLCFRMSERKKGKVEMSVLADQEEVEVARSALNPGSVGQPRDYDPRASCALYDCREGKFKVIRLEYDIAATQAKILKAGLPEFLALRLSYGQ